MIYQKSRIVKYAVIIVSVILLTIFMKPFLYNFLFGPFPITENEIIEINEHIQKTTIIEKASEKNMKLARFTEIPFILPVCKKNQKFYFKLEKTYSCFVDLNEIPYKFIVVNEHLMMYDQGNTRDGKQAKFIFTPYPATMKAQECNGVKRVSSMRARSEPGIVMGQKVNINDVLDIYGFVTGNGFTMLAYAYVLTMVILLMYCIKNIILLTMTLHKNKLRN